MQRFKVILLYILVLSGISFFNPAGIIEPTQGKLILYLVFFLTIVVAVFGRERNITYPKFLYSILILSIIASCFVAANIHQQSLQESVVATLYYLLPYTCLFILIQFNLPVHVVEKLFVRFAIAGMCVWFVNFLTFPQVIFGSISDNVDMSRGMIRIKIPFIEFIVLLIFYCINRWLNTSKKKYIVWAVIAYLFVVLSLTRQYIIFTTLFAILYIIRKASWAKKVVTVITLCLFTQFILPQIPIFSSLMEVTSTQIQNNEEEDDIRIKSWRFYTQENQTNGITKIFGNGVPSFKSQWGARFEQDISENGCYAVDVGWAGFYWYFGAFATASLLLLFGKAALRKKRT